ncbi:sorbosone dehydrogenase family protein [Reichenbachiella sp. MALMAid0571]|uniref:PQQ-dependent sugar dehydrogenase n=1 Tax=Reichenbachiella sp. MALMAid0571 TaxID=3143939 RepID=UPI0032DF39AA
MNFKLLQSLLLMMLFCVNIACSSTTDSDDSFSDEGNVPIADQLSKIKLPEGFKISIYAENVDNARSMALGANGTVFVGTRNAKKVYALVDADGDNNAEEVLTIGSDLKTPNGVAFWNGSLYVAEIDKLWRYDNIESNLKNVPKPKLIYDDYPSDNHHGWKYIAFGPDGKLYIPVGAPCNICESKNEIYATITRMNPDGTGREIYARGVRNSVGLAWHPTTKQLWFTDNGRDQLGDNVPPCELNKVTKAGQHFGYPYCHGGDIGDPEFGHKFSCDEFEPPARKLDAHVAPLGLKFYTGDMFPEKYKNQVFIPEHGSWNRSKKIGYRISLVKVENNRAVSYETFAEGWLDEKEQEAWGRPVDLLVMPDGAMLVSDDKKGVIYRIAYVGE